MKIRFFRFFLAMAVCFAISATTMSCDDKQSNNTWKPVTTESGTTQSNGSNDDTSSMGDVSAETNETDSTADTEESNWSQDYK